MTLWDDLIQNFRKLGTKEWDQTSIISSIVVVLVVIAFAIYINKHLNKNAAERNANPRYTIGVTGAKHHNFRISKPTVEYFYTVNNTTYSGESNGKVLMASDDQVKTFGDKLLSNIDAKFFPQISTDVEEIVIPVVNLVKGKKHNHISLEEFKRQIDTWLQNEKIYANSSVLVLQEFSMTGYERK